MPSSRPIHWSSVIRQAHLYLGMLIAPSLLMFAASGALQIFRLNDAKPGCTPPAIVATLGQLHKNQQLSAPVRPDRAGRGQGQGQGVGQGQGQGQGVGERRGGGEAGPAPRLSKVVLQWFSLIVALGLFVSTALGIWMGAMQSRWKVAARWLLLAGIVIPVAILFV